MPQQMKNLDQSDLDHRVDSLRSDRHEKAYVYKISRKL